MTKHSKLTPGALMLFLSALVPLVANAQPAPKVAAPAAPKVVFVGDYITAQWASAFAANPNWINQGDPEPLYLDSSGATETLASFQANVVSLHPAIVHLLIGLPDAVSSHDPTYAGLVPGFLTYLTEIVNEAKAANIQVVLGLEPFLPNLNNYVLPQINAAIASFGAANNIPVINYADALCVCVNSTMGFTNINIVVAPGGSVSQLYTVPENSFQQYGGGAYFTTGTAANFPAYPALPWDDDGVITPTGYNLMTQMAESTIDTLNLKLVSGWLSDVEQPDENTEGITSTGRSLTNINTVTTPSVIKFIPIGYYSDGSQHPMLNSSFQGSSGTWASSNPLVMTVNQLGVAWAISSGATSITYTAPNGVAFSRWVMYVN
jgi:hypothetical protein